MKDILVLCDSNDSNNDRVETALAYATAFDSNITGVHLIPYPVIPVYGGMYPDSASYSAIFQMDKAEEHAKEIEKDFIQLANDNVLPYDWKVIDGLDLDFVIENARYSDMVVAPAVYSHYGDQGSHHLCNYFATHLGRPLLITPDLNKVFNLPNRIIIAWNESHEAARAVHDALPILKRAEHIQIVCVSKRNEIEKEKENIIRGELLQRHLKHHDIQADVFAPDKLAKGVGHTILEYAFKYNAELIVMGAYGHSRFKEIILGGTTKHIIENSTLPLFVSN